MAELKQQQEQLRITGDKEMKKRLEEERIAFEARMKEQEAALEEERRKNKESVEA